MKTLSIPDRLYHAILGTWCAAVVGVVVLFGGRYLPAKSPVSPVVPLGSVERIRQLENEVASLRQQNEYLIGVVARLDPENSVVIRSGLP